MELSTKIYYLLKSAWNYYQTPICPYCGYSEFTFFDRKALVTKLLECTSCNLMFRHPIDKQHNANKFYNKIYKQKGITTDLPTEGELKLLLKSSFNATNRSINEIETILRLICGELSGKSILDYGCSWGYSSWQFQKIGMKVQGYEIGIERMNYGIEKLGLKIVNEEHLIDGYFDVIFLSHVIEHLSDIASLISLFLTKLKPGGFIIILCPNGSNDLYTNKFQIFHRLWGMVHPNMITDKFLKYVFQKYPYFISSSPYKKEDIRSWDQRSCITELNGGDELLCIVKTQL
jgi:2-polyprenyl-3-methyl-5-hydroxy-6-metoxy-1,4-benzoquinol methylase